MLPGLYIGRRSRSMVIGSESDLKRIVVDGLWLAVLIETGDGQEIVARNQEVGWKCQ